MYHSCEIEYERVYCNVQIIFYEYLYLSVGILLGTSYMVTRADLTEEKAY